MRNTLLIISSLILATANAFADNIEETLAKKGHAVICVQTTGVLHVENLHDEINKKIQGLKEHVYLSVPTVSLSLLNVGEKEAREPGALAVLCVTVSKKK